MKQPILRAFGEMTSLGNRNDTSATSSEKDSPTILKQNSALETERLNVSFLPVTPCKLLARSFQ